MFISAPLKIAIHGAFGGDGATTPAARYRDHASRSADAPRVAPFAQFDLHLRKRDPRRLMASRAQALARKRPSYHSTEISATDSREEIKRLLDRADLGITDVRWVAPGGKRAELFFRIDRRLYKIAIHAPEKSKDPDRAFRRLHRGVAHLLKNAIAVAEEGLCSVGEILATFLLTSDDITVGEAVLRLEAGSSQPVMLALAPAQSALVPAIPAELALETKARTS